MRRGTGDGRLVLIAGEAGVGKSALVEQAERGPARGHLVLGGLRRPVHPAAARPPLRHRQRARRRVAGTVPRPTLPVRNCSVPCCGRSACRASCTCWSWRTSTGPTRPPSTCCVSSAGGSGTSRSCCWPPTGTRAWRATDPLRLALGDLATHRCVRRIGLPPLSADAVAVLAGGSGLDPAALYRLTGGNPFYVSQAVQAGMSDVPATARDAVLARAARLGSDARAVLDAAALIGTRVEVALLESVAGCPPSAIDELLASGLLTGDGTALRFRHEIARLAVARSGRRPPVRRHPCSDPGVAAGSRLRRRCLHGVPRGGGRRWRRRRCAMRPRPPAGPPRWPRTVRRPPSSNGHCASRTGRSRHGRRPV